MSECWWADVPNYFSVSWRTLPPFERRGYASSFYEYAVGRIESDGRTVEMIECGTREDKPAAIAWLEKYGFKRKNRYPNSELVLSEFDSAQFASYPTRAATAGLIIKPLAEIIPHDAEWQRKLYDLEWIFELDEPTSVPPKQEPFEDYQKNTLESPDFKPECWFVALDGDRFAGMSCLWPDKMKSTRWNTGWTGVDRPYRRKGLAMAMKVAALTYAQQSGVEVVKTDNHETNWMYQINLRLGFKPIPASLHYEKRMGRE
ncbi:MAG: GNAT family N-acetyltransferase, partial [Candidatus Promineifilaceae bacterium]